MYKMFPRSVNCDYREIGPSGTEQILGTLCTLPLNSFFEKIYIFLWFWFNMLAIFTIIGLIWDLFVIFYNKHWKQIIESKLAEISKENNIIVNSDLIVSKLDYGDWMIVYQLLQVLKPIESAQLLSIISQTLTESNNESTNIQMDSNKI